MLMRCVEEKLAIPKTGPGLVPISLSLLNQTKQTSALFVLLPTEMVKLC